MWSLHVLPVSPRVGTLTKKHAVILVSILPPPGQPGRLMEGKGTGWNNVFLPRATSNRGNSPLSGEKKRLGLLMHRRKHEVSPLLSLGWQREFRAQDYIRQLTPGTGRLSETPPLRNTAISTPPHFETPPFRNLLNSEWWGFTEMFNTLPFRKKKNPVGLHVAIPSPSSKSPISPLFLHQNFSLSLSLSLSLPPPQSGECGRRGGPCDAAQP